MQKLGNAARRVAPRCGLPAQASIEMVVCLPVLMLLLFCLIDCVSMFRAGLLARAAATEAATYFSRNPDASDSQIENHVTSSLSECTTDGISVYCGQRQSHIDRYTMRVRQKDGWRDAEAFSTTSSRRFTCSIGCRLFIPAFVGGSAHITETASATGHATEEANLS